MGVRNDAFDWDQPQTKHLEPRHMSRPNFVALANQTPIQNQYSKCVLLPPQCVGPAFIRYKCMFSTPIQEDCLVRFKTSCEGHTHLKTLASKQNLVSQDKKMFGLDMCPNIEVLGVKVGPSFWGMNYIFPTPTLDGGCAKLKMSISNQSWEWSF